MFPRYNSLLNISKPKSPHFCAGKHMWKSIRSVVFFPIFFHKDSGRSSNSLNSKFLRNSRRNSLFCNWIQHGSTAHAYRLYMIYMYIYICLYVYIYDLKIKPLASGVLGGAEDYQINTQRNHFKFEQLNSLRSQTCFWKKGNIPNSQQKISKNYNEAVPPFSFEKKQGRGPPTLTNHRSTQPPTTSPNRL